MHVCMHIFVSKQSMDGNTGNKDNHCHQYHGDNLCIKIRSSITH